MPKNELPLIGQTYLMFHGTSLKAAISIMKNGFSRSPDGMLGAGIYVSRSFKKAKAYIKPPEPVVLKLNVNVGKVSNFKLLILKSSLGQKNCRARRLFSKKLAIQWIR